MKLDLALLVSMASLWAVANAQGEIASTCDVFEWNGQPSYLKYSTGGLAGPTRVSAASTCALEAGAISSDDNPIYCPLSTRATFYSYFWGNTSGIISTSEFNNHWHNLVYSAIQSTLNGADWNYTSNAIISTTQPLPAGTSAYLNFTQLYSCYVGTLRNCTGDTVENGTVLEGCSPIYRSYSAIPNASARNGVSMRPNLEGLYTVVNISQATVDQFRDSPVEPLVGSVSGGTKVQSHATVLFGTVLMSVMSALLL